MDATPVSSPDRPAGPNRLGPIAYAATTLYVDDLEASIAWYRRTLGLEPASVSHDEFAYARYRVGDLVFVLEPASAATDPHDSGRTGAAALNLVVQREPATIRAELLEDGVPCTDLKASPRFETFLVRDPDGHRIYVTKPRPGRDP
jgi:catechol 2,3-dioxygenase-like lactoylglutathione lyase family enzyme